MEEKAKRVRQQWRAEKAKSKSVSESSSKHKTPASAPSAPPPPAPAVLPAAPAPPPPPAPQRTQPGNHQRGALLSSIEGFKKGGLKKAQSNDRSGPKV